MFFVLFDAGRFMLHARAVDELESRLYDGLPPVAAAALPLALNPFRWQGIVETAGAYRRCPWIRWANSTPNKALSFQTAVDGRATKCAREEAFGSFSTREISRWSQQPAH